MKRRDYVKLIVEKEEYAKQGAHKGMVGFITTHKNTQRYFSVDLFELRDDYIGETVCVKVKEDDLALIKELPDYPDIKDFDKVRLINDRPKYAEKGVYKGAEGVVEQSYGSGADVEFGGELYTDEEGQLNVTVNIVTVDAEDLEVIG